MTDRKVVLLFIHDFSGGGKDKFYLYSEGVIREAVAREVVEIKSELICHDYWLVAPSLFRAEGSLPCLVTDVEELRVSTSGSRKDREERDARDVCTQLLELKLESQDVIGRYRNIIFRNSEVDVATLSRVAEAILKLSDHVEQSAKNLGEWERFSQIERPVMRYLLSSAAKGIHIDRIALARHKQDLDFFYYTALKEFSACYDMPLEVPSESEVVEYLEPLGFDFDGVGVDYVLNFVPMSNGFSDKLAELKKISASRKALNSMPLSQELIYPIVDVFGSVTSRIYYKDPSLQNLSKRYRDVIAPAPGRVLSYVDFGQFEAGIMAALSDDEGMLALFRAGDVYALAAEQIFGGRERRKESKRLFLSYAYGMKRKNLIDAAVGLGADRDRAKAFFKKFVRFEAWKLEICSQFRGEGKIGTSLGNYLRRSSENSLSEKEKRSAVSQVVQGTASLIFKKALLRLSCDARVSLKIPMHDAVLFEHMPGFDPQTIVTMFSQVMTEHFEGRIQGKAELAAYVAG